jgi:hypothetical protein
LVQLLLDHETGEIVATFNTPCRRWGSLLVISLAFQKMEFGSLHEKSPRPSVPRPPLIIKDRYGVEPLSASGD